MAAVSQNSRILDVLADGEPHSVREIHAIAGFSRLNSRVSELRKHGYAIECFHVPGKTGSDGYGYRLLSDRQVAPSALPIAEQVVPGGSQEFISPATCSTPEQLRLVAA